MLLSFKHCSYTPWGQGYIHSYKQSEGVFSGTIWSVLQMMVSSTMNICKTDHWNRPLCYSMNKWHTTVQKDCRLVAFHCRAVVCVWASDAKQNIDNAFMRIFFLSCSLFFFFPIGYCIFDHNTIQFAMYCLKIHEGTWNLPTNLSDYFLFEKQR